MDTQSLYYFSELAKDLHMTRTAERLFISQQTLSNHILRLEEYYGVRLLNRKPSLSLTCAGEYVLGFAETFNRESANLNDILAEIRQEDRGLILFGASTLRMRACLPDILPEFSAKFPNVEVRITDTNSKKLEKMICKGDLDLAIVLSGEENAGVIKTHLMSDQVYLCVTGRLLERYYGDGASELIKNGLKGADVKDFSELPFCMLDNRMGQNIKRCFEAAGIVPNIYTTSEYMQISASIGLKGLAAFFTTRTGLLNLKGGMPEDIYTFPLNYNGRPFVQDISIIRHKDRYRTGYGQYFYDLILTYFREAERLSIDELVNSRREQSSSGIKNPVSSAPC